MDLLATLIPLLPFLAALFIGTGILTGQLSGEAGERTTSGIASWAITLSCFLALALLSADLLDKNSGTFNIGQWLGSDHLKIQFTFITTGFNTVLGALFAILLLIVTRFSINYMHREIGFHRFFFILSLFSAAMLLLVLAGSAVGTFIGWEIAGLCSYLLIGYAYDRPVATINATRVFVTNRIGDAGFILGIFLSYYYSGTINWSDLNAMAVQLTMPTATVIALCFAIAAFAKSAQLPFSPWLARAMEGPTPSSSIFYGAVMIHAGVFLIIMLQPVFEQTPLIMYLLVIVGLVTALYSFTVGLTQTDVKSSLCYAISGQLGLMFLECGLGFWELAAWHLCAHAIVRCYQVLTAPSLMHNVLGNPIKPVGRNFANIHWLYIASIQRFWLDPIADRILTRPIQGLGQDLDHFDSYVIDRVMGAPVSSTRPISTLTEIEQIEQKRLGEIQPNYSLNQFVHGHGVVGKILEWIADVMGWFEERLVLRGVNIDIVDVGRKLGHIANAFESLLLKPRYLVLFVFVVLLFAATR